MMLHSSDGLGVLGYARVGSSPTDLFYSYLRPWRGTANHSANRLGSRDVARSQTYSRVMF